MILAVCLVFLLFASDASCQTVVTYSSRPYEELLCPITDETLSATWRDNTIGTNMANYFKGVSDIEIVTSDPKHENFMYSDNTTTFRLFIQPVEDEDGGDYLCSTGGGGGTENDYAIVVEVLAKPTVQYESQDVDVLNVTVGKSYDLTCSAAGARSVSDLSLVWDPSLVVEISLIITPDSDDDMIYKNYSITSTYNAVRSVSSITCQLSGYVMQDEINDQRLENISHTVNLNVRYAPICCMTIQEVEDCRNITLTCNCDAVPADITQYLFFNEGSEIYDGANNTFTLSVADGTLSSFSCSAANSIGPGNKTDAKDHKCDEGTTAPLSTNEPTSTKAMGTTTVEPESKSTDNPETGGLGTGAIVGISLGVLAVVIVIVVIALMMFKPGESGSKSESSNSGKGIENDGMESPPPVYSEVKKKSDKADNNGAGPEVDPEIPTYGTSDKNMTKDQAPAPHSSMIDSTNSSNPKQDMEMQYADLDHGNKPPSDEVRKPKKEPTEYATVQPVIV